MQMTQLLKLYSIINLRLKQNLQNLQNLLYDGCNPKAMVTDWLANVKSQQAPPSILIDEVATFRTISFLKWISPVKGMYGHVLLSEPGQSVCLLLSNFLAVFQKLL